MRIAFFGSGAFGLPTLRELSRSHTLVGVVSQPDRPAGRGGRLTPTPVAEWAAASLPGTPLLKPEKCNAPEVVAAIRGWDVDAWVVIAFGQKLGRALLADRFAINLHASLLPRWRGAAPINAAILAGDTRTGNSVITLADRMDAGLVLGQSTRDIPGDMTAGTLHDLLATDGPALVLHVLATMGADRKLQDESLVTIAPKLSKADSWVDFDESAEACRRRINGLSPWPGVSARFRNEPLKLLRAAVSPAPAPRSAQAGSVIDATRGLVACGRHGGQGSVLSVLEVQPAGKKAMTWRDFANGQRVQTEEVLAGGRAECSPPPSGT